MSRIIGGRAGGRTLTVPDSGTRPTTDRVREALFSRLESQQAIDDAVVLDLYAGSGAVGLEALSRGARRVDWVDNGHAAHRAITANAAALAGSVPGEGAAHKASVAAILEQGPQALYARADEHTRSIVDTHGVDVVFLDPPYDVPVERIACHLGALLTAGWVGDGSLVIVERSTRSDAVADVLPEVLGEAARRYSAPVTKTYGETTMEYFDVRGQ